MSEGDNKRISVHRDDLVYLNELTGAGDDARRNVSGVLLTVYGTGVLGMFALVTLNNLQLSRVEQVFFSLTLVSAGLIVFTALLEKFIDYMAKIQVGKQHVRNIRSENTVNTTGRPNPLSPKGWTSGCLSIIPMAQLLLVCINATSAITYVILRIF